MGLNQSIPIDNIKVAMDALNAPAITGVEGPQPINNSLFSSPPNQITGVQGSDQPPVFDVKDASHPAFIVTSVQDTDLIKSENLTLFPLQGVIGNIGYSSPIKYALPEGLIENNNLLDNVHQIIELEDGDQANKITVEPATNKIGTTIDQIETAIDQIETATDCTLINNTDKHEAENSSEQMVKSDNLQIKELTEQIKAIEKAFSVWQKQSNKDDKIVALLPHGMTLDPSVQKMLLDKGYLFYYEFIDGPYIRVNIMCRH